MRTRLSSSSRRFSTTSSSSRVDRTPMSRCWRASAMWCCSGRSASSSRVFTVTASLAKATASSTRLLAFSFACFASDEANVETSTVHAGGSFSSPKAMAGGRRAPKPPKKLSQGWKARDGMRAKSAERCTYRLACVPARAKAPSLLQALCSVLQTSARLDGWGQYLTTSIWQKKNQERRESELRRAEQERDALSEAGRSRHIAFRF